MQRAGVALLIVIAVIAGFTARAIIAPSGIPVATVSGNADVTTADAFYAALNSALAGGALDPLEQMLARIYQDHDPSTGETRTAGAFLEDLRAKGRSPQGVRLEPISVTASGDSLIVGIEPIRDDSLLAAGMTVRPELPPPHLETLRVIDGKIVDRWAPAIPWLDIHDANDATFSASALTQVSATLMRVAVAGGLTYEWDTTSTGVLTIETGSARWSASVAGARETSSDLHLGEFALVPAGAHVRLRPLDGAPVTALLFMTDPARAAEVMHPSTQLTEVAQGTPKTMLWSGPLSDIDSVTTYWPARMVLPPGMWLELQDTQGVDILIAIDGGQLEVRSPDGTVTVLGPDRWPDERTGPVQLDANHAGVVVANQTVTLQNLSDDPVAIVVIAVERTGGEVSDDASAVAD